MAHQNLLDLLDESMLARGISMEHSSNVAWRPDDAIEVISSIKDSSWAILGGDVLVHDGEGYRSTYDNWYTEPEQGEKHAEYLTRSYSASVRYIQDYMKNNSGDFVFVLVGGRVL